MKPGFDPLEYESGKPVDGFLSEFDAAVRTLNAECLMAGASLQLEFRTDPSFLEALALWGDRHQMVLQRVPEACPLKINALGIRSLRETYLGGVPRRTAYFHHLRIHPSVRGGSSLARGFQLLRKLSANLPVDAAYTSILRENRPALEALENEAGRGPLPRYNRFCDFTTFFLPLIGPGSRWPFRGRSLFAANRADPGMRVRPLSFSDREDLCELSRRFGALHDGAPVLPEPSLWQPGMELFPGLRIEDFLGAFEGERLVGAIGTWDQSPWKQYRLTGSGQGLARVWPFLRILARLCGVGIVPALGENIPYVLFDPWFVVPGKEGNILPLLLREAVNRAKARPFLFGAFGLPRGPVRDSLAKRFFALSVDSTVYHVDWLLPPQTPHSSHGRPFAALGFL